MTNQEQYLTGVPGHPDHFLNAEGQVVINDGETLGDASRLSRLSTELAKTVESMTQDRPESSYVSLNEQPISEYDV